MGRFKFWTDGERSLVFMGIESCTKVDEGVYRCVITNRFGKREHKFKLFISSKSDERISKIKRKLFKDLSRKGHRKKERQVFACFCPDSCDKLG